MNAVLQVNASVRSNARAQIPTPAKYTPLITRWSTTAKSGKTELIVGEIFKRYNCVHDFLIKILITKHESFYTQTDDGPLQIII